MLGKIVKFIIKFLFLGIESALEGWEKDKEGYKKPQHRPQEDPNINLSQVEELIIEEIARKKLERQGKQIPSHSSEAKKLPSQAAKKLEPKKKIFSEKIRKQPLAKFKKANISKAQPSKTSINKEFLAHDKKKLWIFKEILDKPKALQ